MLFKANKAYLKMKILPKNWQRSFEMHTTTRCKFKIRRHGNYLNPLECAASNPTWRLWIDECVAINPTWRCMNRLRKAFGEISGWLLVVNMHSWSTWWEKGKHNNDKPHQTDQARHLEFMRSEFWLAGAGSVSALIGSLWLACSRLPM